MKKQIEPVVETEAQRVLRFALLDAVQRSATEHQVVDTAPHVSGHRLLMKPVYVRGEDTAQDCLEITVVDEDSTTFNGPIKRSILGVYEVTLKRLEK